MKERDARPPPRGLRLVLTQRPGCRAALGLNWQVIGIEAVAPTSGYCGKALKAPN